MRNAFTLIETLCVMVIIATLSAIAFPAMYRAVLAAQATSSINKLSQLHIAFSLYRSDYGGDGIYGTAAEMGLPDSSTFYKGAYLAVSKDLELWHSSCGKHPDYPVSGQVQYTYSPANEAYPANYFKKNEENSILLIDENCSDHSTPLYSPFYPKVVIGLRLSGQVQKHVTYNNPDLVSNWNP